MSSIGYSEVNNKREIIFSALQDISALLCELNLEQEAITLTDRAKNIKDIFNVLFIGEFKTGKTTLINALLGSEDDTPKIPFSSFFLYLLMVKVIKLISTKIIKIFLTNRYIVSLFF